jgi:hypothetical protein
MNPSAEMTGLARVWTPRRVALLVLFCLMIGAGLSVFSARAYAAFVPVPTAQGAHLSLKSDPQPVSFLDMSPGSVEHWQIDASLVDASSTLTLQFNRDGALITNPRGLVVQVDRCDQVWTNVTTTPVCGGGEANVFGPVAASSIPETTIYDLAGLTNTQDKYLLVTLSIPDTAAARADTTLMGLTAQMGFGLTASGADPTQPADPSDPLGPPDPGTPGTPSSPTSPSSLAFTGVDIGGLLLLAFGALGVGLLLMASRKARSSFAGKASK